MPEGEHATANALNANERPSDATSVGAVEHTGQVCPIFPSDSQSHFPGRFGAKKRQILLVPGERIELPTNGLQKREPGSTFLYSTGLF
jgi:hypothetical protein